MSRNSHLPLLSITLALTGGEHNFSSTTSAKYLLSTPHLSHLSYDKMVLGGHTDETWHEAVPPMLPLPVLVSSPPPTIVTILAAVMGPLHPTDVPSTL